MITHPDFNPIAISLGPVSIHWYGLMYLFGFISAMWLGSIRAKKSNSSWQISEISDMIFYMALGVIVGGRLGYVLFYKPIYYLSNPMDIFALWDGGMSFHGGLLGVIIAMWFYARKTNRRFLQVADFIAPLVPIGLFFGRIGNFINQELVGRTTDMPWGVLFQRAPDFPRHPSQLYEALLEGLLLFVMVWCYSNKPKAVGKIAGLFVMGYGCFRFIVEFFRQPDDHLGFIVFEWMSMGQLLSLPMILIGMFFIARKQKSVTN